jgi:predicted nucleic acid-binding protein
MPVLVDTSVLLRLRDPNDPNHSSCRAALDPAQVNRHGIHLCAQVLIEYWVVATRPAANNGFGLSPADAEADVVALRALLPCVPEPADVANRWQALVTRHAVSGKPAHDARLVAVMEAHRLRRLLTLNPSDFGRYVGIEVMSPPELLAAAPLP